MEDKKMTAREFYNAVIAAGISDELSEYAQGAIDKLDAANEKRKNTVTKKQVANKPFVDAVTACLNGEDKTASVIAAEAAEALGEAVSVQKASAILRGLVNEGIATSKDVKVPKKGTVKAYTLAE